MSELPFLGIGPSSTRPFVAFSNATVNCACGFSTSDGRLAACPNCGRRWRDEQPLEQAKPPQPGTVVALVCVVCGEGFVDGRAPVYAGGTDLAHGSCLSAQPTVGTNYEKLVASAVPVDGPHAQTAAKAPQRKRRRRRKRPGTTTLPPAS